METIKELLKRHLTNARKDLERVKKDKEAAIAKYDQAIAAYMERCDVYENLLELDWKLLAKNTLDEK